jgi:hypothetical protein
MELSRKNCLFSAGRWWHAKAQPSGAPCVGTPLRAGCVVTLMIYIRTLSRESAAIYRYLQRTCRGVRELEKKSELVYFFWP